MMGDGYAKERESLRTQARLREEEAFRQHLIDDVFSIRLESPQSPRPTTQPQPSRSESIPRISQFRENTAFPSSRQAQQAGSSARSLQTGSPSYSREGQLVGASSDASQESGWGSPSSWLANLSQGWQDVKDQYLFHHVPGCRCFRCNPAYYIFNGEYVTRPVVDFLLGSCPIGCLCPYCLEKRSIWKAQNKCRNDGHQILGFQGKIALPPYVEGWDSQAL